MTSRAVAAMVAALTAFVSASHVSAATTTLAITTVTTSVASEKCKPIPPPPGEEPGDYGSFRCGRTAKYSLIVDYADARDNLTVVSPTSKKSDLELWQRVGTSFSTLGDNVEWRLENGKPVAITMRYTLADPEIEGKSTSFLVVAKITAKQTCATDKVAPGPTQNLTARKLAATSASRPCLPSP